MAKPAFPNDHRAAILPFLRAIHAWEWAMTGAATQPHPVSLLPMIRLDEAAFDADAAREWAEHIGTVLASNEQMLEEAQRTTANERQLVEKWQGVIGYLRTAHRHALEHVALLGAE